MNHFNYQENELYCESVPVAAIAEKIGTPFYLYSTATLSRHFEAFDQAFDFPHITCFATKSCSNIAILRLFGKLGSGADIVSGGELFRALTAGIDPRKIVYSGVGKTAEELRYALQSNILLFNIESLPELDLLQQVAADLGVQAPVAFRVNPDVDPKTHAYISTGLAENKFGLPIETAHDAYRKAMAMDNITVQGVSCHIGSQLTDISPCIESLRKLKAFIGRLRADGITISYLDLGGGLGIRYEGETPPEPAEYARAIKAEMTGLDCTLILEPGRVIVGNAGILVTKVLYTKKNAKKFIIVDAAMNDLARPSLYKAYHGIQAIRRSEKPGEVADLVGPICESGDFLAKGQNMPAVEPGDLLAVMSAGAYGFTMSSNYNSRPRVAEILVHDAEFHTIRARETKESLIAGETIPAFLS